jgi:hypothetical protein
VLIVLFICIFLSGVGALTLGASRRHKRFLATLAGVEWLIMLPLLILLNDLWPYTGGGDDGGYHAVAAGFGSLAEALNPSTYIGTLEQPGYPILLAPAALLSGGDLLALKLVNLTTLVLITCIWSRIGFELEGERFARLVGFFVAGLTPIWYYAFFLLKDLPIALLQSLTVLSAIWVMKGQWRKGLGLGAVATLLLIPLRSYLAVMNLAVLAAGALLSGFAAGRARKRDRVGMPRTLIAGASLVCVIGLAYVATDPGTASALGLRVETRTISRESIEMTAQFHGQASLIQRALFPILYFVSETAGLNALFSGDMIDPGIFRGLLALPWIFFYLPFLMIGIWTLATRIGPRKLAGSPWVIVIVLCVVYLGVSWIVGDTTRWRIPDLPALATIAALGFSSIREATRSLITIGWPALVLNGAALYYWVLT